MPTFVRNNIRYRSAAANALEGYFNSKAFILNEMVDSKNGFSETATELMLLLFNKHAEWLNYVERLLLDKERVSTHDVNIIRDEFIREVHSISQIFDQNMDVFDANFIRHWIKAHKYNTYMLHATIQKLVGMEQIVAFPYITEGLVSYITTTMFELYELDCLLGSDIVKKKITSNNKNPNTLILFVDDVTAAYRAQTNISPEKERFDYYLASLIADTEFSVELRDYSSCLEDSDALNAIYNDIRRHLESKPQVVSFEVNRKGS